MALNYKKKKNLIRSPDEYTRYYGNFRGVDFSSEETEVNEQRFAYAVNMYKDYRSSEGNAIETIPGFRRRFETPLQQNARSGTATNEKINGIHEFTYFENNERKSILIVHAGTNLYAWDKEHSVNTIVSMYAEIPKDEPLTISMKGTHCTEVVSIEIPASKSGDLPSSTFEYDEENGVLTLQSDVFTPYKGTNAIIRYKEKIISKNDAICSNMACAESKSFSFNNRLYILDGTTFRVCYLDKDKNWNVEPVTSSEYTYTPTIYKGIPAGDIVDNISKYEYEQKNLINNFYVHEYAQQDENLGDIEVEFPLYSNDSIVSVIGYNPFTKEQVVYENNNIIYKIVFYKDAQGNDTEARKIVFTAGALGRLQVKLGIYITYQKRTEVTSEDEDGVSPAEKDVSKINKCTNFVTFDNRIFLTGNPDYPNLLFYCGNNNETGFIDPTYFGELDYVQDGVEDSPITGLITVADTLAVLKNNAKQDSSIYFHTRMETGGGVTPITYPSQPGLSGVGCLGACVNFLDDPIFISPLGVEAIGQLSVRLERAVEHRSSLIDAKLTSMDLSKAKFAEWDGYLVLLLPGGKMFLADSRQRYTHSSGVMQYEWYYVEGVGVYEDDVTEYYYSSEKEDDLPTEVVGDDGKTYEVVLARNIYNHDSYLDNGKTYKPESLINSPVKKDAYADDDEELEVKPLDDYGYYFYILKPTWDGHSMKDGYPETEVKAIFCENRGSRTGGTFHEATHIINVDRNLFFGTDNGVICSFNFDLFKDGMLPEHFYSFDGHTINCGVATKLDNCGIPHLTKSTIKKSTVLKTKSMHKFAAKIRVRTNNKGYESIARVNSNIFDFENTDFSDYSFANSDQTIFSIKEKEKHWVEKQHWIYSDEFERPFAVHYLAFRYKVSGRIKG
jgi:hypothetical protein